MPYALKFLFLEICGNINFSPLVRRWGGFGNISLTGISFIKLRLRFEGNLIIRGLNSATRNLSYLPIAHHTNTVEPNKISIKFCDRASLYAYNLWYCGKGAYSVLMILHHENGMKSRHLGGRISIVKIRR